MKVRYWQLISGRTLVDRWRIGAVTSHQQGLNDNAARIWLNCVDRFQLWGTCRKQAFDGNSGRTLRPVLEPLQEIHFLVQDSDDNREVNDYPEDVVMLAPMDADLVRQLRQ